MVDNDEMGRLRLSPGTKEKTIASLLIDTPRSQATLLLGTEPVPGKRLTPSEVKLGSIPARR